MQNHEEHEIDKIIVHYTDGSEKIIYKNGSEYKPKPSFLPNGGIILQPEDQLSGADLSTKYEKDV